MSAPSSDPPSTPSETLNLALEAQRGNPQVFAQLYERLAPAIYTWAKLRIRPMLRSHVDPQDVVQEVWTRALRSLSTFEPTKTKFRAWIFGIAKNVLLEALRKHGRGEGTASSTVFERQPDRAITVSRQVARDEELQKFFERVKSLPEPDRSILIHFGLEGLSLPETAERVGLSRDATAKRWQRLRAKMMTTQLPDDLLQTLE